MIPMIVRVRVDRVRKAGTVGSDLFSFPPAGGCLSALASRFLALLLLYRKKGKTARQLGKDRLPKRTKSKRIVIKELE